MEILKLSFRDISKYFDIIPVFRNIGKIPTDWHKGITTHFSKNMLKIIINDFTKNDSAGNLSV
jgi:hypothetical protein